jgi:hypothetical protein
MNIAVKDAMESREKKQMMQPFEVDSGVIDSIKAVLS